MRRLICVLWIVLIAGSTYAQYGFAVDGYIKDAKTGDAISGARISLNKRNTEAYSNRYGYYSISVPAHDVLLTVEYQGFHTDTQSFYIEENKRQDFELVHHVSDGLANFEVSTASQSQITDPQTSKIDVPIGTLKQMPFLFSENDVVKGLQMFPGVDFGSAGTSDLIVRGGEVGQNLMLLDGTPIYSQGHFFGYISNFNTEIINNIQLYKGAFPARYGGRVSSVVDITSTSGSKKEVEASLTISPILANINVGLPLDDKGSSIAINIRRSYLDILISPALGSDALSFGDFQTKMDLKLSDRDVLSLSYYNLSDKLSVSTTSDDSTTNVTYDIGFVEKNRTGTARWNRNHNARLFSSVSASYTGFTHAEELVETNLDPLPGNPRQVKNEIDFFMGDIALNGDLEYNHSNKHFLRYGLQNTMHLFLPGKLNVTRFPQGSNIGTSELSGDSVHLRSLEMALYVEDEFRIDDNLKINVGLRNVIYSHDGKTGIYPEPRLSGRQKIDSISAFKFSFMRTNQFVHLYNNGGTGLEVIVWIPADQTLKPESTNQLTLGYTRNVKQKWEWQMDAYYKTLGNQLLFYTISFFDQQSIADNALIGKGTSYGLENYLKFNSDNVSAWFGYDFSVARRTFEGLNRGESFFFDYDRRHTFKSSLIYSSSQWVLSTNLVVATGNPFTLPNAKYRDINGRLVLSYDEINNYRSKTYFRSDIKVQYFWGNYNDFNNSIELTIYNMTATPNTSNIISELDRNFPNQKYKAVKESNFLFMPSISYKLTI